MLLAATQAAQHTTASRFLYSLGVPNIGSSNAKMICKAFDSDFERIRHCTAEELTAIDGVGEVIAQSFVAFFADANNNKMVDDLLRIVTWETETGTEDVQNMDGLVLVITGTLTQYTNRNALKEVIESRGGKVTGSVTKNTSYLINNDSLSNSSKNKKAKELNVPILTEDQVIEQFSLPVQ